MVLAAVLVPEIYSLWELHGVIQAAMGWESLHLFEFRIHAVRDGWSEICTEPSDKALGSFRSRKNAELAYVYDMGDWWEHEVHAEDREVINERRRYPVCIGGAGAWPPEDCCGSGRYLDRDDEALGLDAADELATIAAFVEQVVFKANRAILDGEDDCRAIESAIGRSQARAWFTACQFSRQDVNRDSRRRVSSVYHGSKP